MSVTILVYQKGKDMVPATIVQVLNQDTVFEYHIPASKSMLERVYSIRKEQQKFQCNVVYPTLPRTEKYRSSCLAESEDITVFLRDIPHFLKVAHFQLAS